MNMRIDTAGGDNRTFTGDNFGTGADRNGDARLNIRIAGFTDRGNFSILDADIGFERYPSDR